MRLFIFYKWALYLFSITSFIQRVNAQYEEKDFIRYTVKEGLCDNYITCLQQDDWGYIWAGTNVGLNRFDGNSFRNFYQESQFLPLASSDIRNLKKFGPHQLAVIGSGGLQLINTRDFSIKHFYIPDSTAFNNLRNYTWDAIQLPDLSYAMSTASGFYVVKEPGTINCRHDAYSLADIGKKRILYGREIFPVNNKEYLIYREQKGLSHYNAEKRVFRDIDPSEEEWRSFIPSNSSPDDHWVVKYQLNLHEFIFVPYRKDSIIFYDNSLKRSVSSALPIHPAFQFSWESKICILNDTVFAINAFNYGFYLFHLDKLTRKITCDGKKFLPSHKIIQLFFDRDKRLWAATSEGLLKQKLNPSSINSYHFPRGTGDTLTGGFACAYTYKNKLYAGRYSLYKGLLIVDPLSMLPQKQVDFYGGGNAWNEILSMEMYHTDTLWLGTNAGILWYDTKTDHYGKLLDSIKYPWASDISAILSPSKNGYAWMCSYLGGLVVRYHIASRTFTAFTAGTTPALPFNKVKSIVYDSYGDVWIGGHSLTRWNNRLQLFDTLITTYAGVNKFNDDILTLVADDNGALWLHNAFNGLLEYRIKEKKFIAYSMKDGLPSNFLQTMSPVINNNIWIGSNSHVTKFDTRTKKVMVFDQYDGLPGHKPSARQIFYDREHLFLYMCAGEYIVRMSTLDHTDADNSSKLMIEELAVNEQHIAFPPAGEIKLDHSQNNIAVAYTIIDFEKNNYLFAYRLNPAENWNSLGRQRSLNLNNLQPGKYSIQLKATGKSGNEKITSIMVYIRPPLWNTIWFRVVTGLLLTGLLYLLYRRRIKQVRQKANIDKLLAQTEMKALHSQMNPHFIFNSLNSIREMILNDKNRQASHYLSKFAQLIRITLDQSGQSLISLRNTIEYLQQYIEMEKIRNADFTYSITAGEELDWDETVLPPMLIQPFIENAIWHGVTGLHKNIHININFRKQNGGLVCIIDDNGIGINQSLENKKTSFWQAGDHDKMHNPVGITNIKKRIQLLNEKYKLQSNVILQDKNDISGGKEKGTLVTLHLPLEITNHE